jgi:hypothetical protein
MRCVITAFTGRETVSQIRQQSPSPPSIRALEQSFHLTAFITRGSHHRHWEMGFGTDSGKNWCPLDHKISSGSKGRPSASIEMQTLHLILRRPNLAGSHSALAYEYRPW